MSINSRPNLYKKGQVIDLNRLYYQITKKVRGVRSEKPHIGITYIPPMTLNMRNTAPKKMVSGADKFSISALPMTFSWNNNSDVAQYKGQKYVGIIMTPQNQRTCGSCWSFAVTGSMSDRIAIKTGRKNPYLGPSYLLSCSLTNSCDQSNLDGCNGGMLVAALNDMSKNAGGVPKSCWSYSWCDDNDTCANGSGDDQDYNNGLIPSFSNKAICEGGTGTLFVYKVQSGSVQSIGDLNSIKQSVYNNGPIPTGFNVFTDFIMGTTPDASGKADGWSATNGIYVHLDTDSNGKTPLGDPIVYNYADPSTLNTNAGGHAVVIVGWGIATVPNFLTVSQPTQKTINLPYWIVRNSWDVTWNEGGYFRIAMTNPQYYINNTVQMDMTTDGSGGVVDFLPDISVLPPINSIDDIANGDNSSKSNFPIWLIIILIIVIIVIIYIFIYHHKIK